LSNHVTGTLPTKIGQLAALKTIDVEHNQLKGPIPTQLGKLKALVSLQLGYNQLTSCS
jgi:Leucine-rich repeat (LRR) protein